MTDLTRKRGDSYADEIVVTGPTGAAVDITGYTFMMTVDPSPSPADNVTKTFEVAGTILDAANGVVEFAPTTVQTDVTPARYYYDIQMTDDVGRIRTIVSGAYTIVQDITK